MITPRGYRLRVEKIIVTNGLEFEEAGPCRRVLVEPGAFQAAPQTERVGRTTVPLKRERLLMVAQFGLARGFACSVVIAQRGAVRVGDVGARRHDAGGRAAGD